MEEKNELNDIILNKRGGSSGSKKLLLAIATLTLILIIVLVIMNSLKSESVESAPAAAAVPEPSAPTEIIDDPLFEPVEVIQEGNTTAAGSEDLGQIAQRIKQEANAPAATVQQAPQMIESKPIPQSVAAAPVPAPAAAPKAVAPVVTPKAAEPVVNTPTIKSTKPDKVQKIQAPAIVKSTPKAAEKSVAKTVEKAPEKTVAKPAEKPVEKAAAKPTEAAAPKAAGATGVYYIQVGSFAKTPNPQLYERLNASGLKYSNIPSGAATKVMVGPFQNEKAARDVLGTVRRNIESGAYITKG
ncbi:MAG: SPOR domain-containing protein [Sulfuricurvum sp.]|jgi:DedD protein|uniref:SPOR domain-containing protein n=1 Tax=Sulfuricurvum sp. TaxID=2025608 RepID=UPI0025FE5EA5|nr:SPOR domain-containing protein [Sulfuricurvum sp.]MCK9374328.1 SPOR domain-containing protein [Sulfuricurvum sp.]